MRLLWEWWLQVWPNLASSAISLPPAFVWHHWRMKKHVTKAIEEAKKL
jgi:hypothetical protein